MLRLEPDARRSCILAGVVSLGESGLLWLAFRMFLRFFSANAAPDVQTGVEVEARGVLAWHSVVSVSLCL